MVPEILYEGTRGPGKTDTLLMKFARYCGLGYGAWWRGIIFRQTYKQLDEIVVKTNRWFPQMFDCRFVGGDQFMWKWDTGEQLLLRHFGGKGDYWNYHGHEYPCILWEELTSWPTNDGYEMMKACWRSSAPFEDMPRLYLSDTNPYGVGHNWVKRYWIDPAPPDTIIREEGKTPRVRIHGNILENKVLMQADPEYYKNLTSITDPNRRAAWLEGSWDITSGGLLDDVWRSPVHVIKPFRIPFSWRIDRSFDWGSSHPFAVVWWAESDGTEVLGGDGQMIRWPKGTVVAIAEWYGWTGKDNEGCRMLAKEVAKGILKRESEMGYNVRPGPADSSIWASENGMCIYDDMRAEKVTWTPADKSPGSRRAGAERLRTLLKNSLHRPQEDVGIYVFENCRQLIRTVPTLPRDEKNPDDIPDGVEDHLYDCVRYRVQSPLKPLAAKRLTGT